MYRFKAIVLSLGILGLLLGYQNCGSKLTTDKNGQLDSGSTITLNGTINKSNIDGCKYLFQSENGDFYIPVKLNPATIQEGAPVKITGALRDDIVTTCMGGTVLEVIQVSQ